MEDLRDRKSAWKLAYASMVASEYAPRVNIDELEYQDAVIEYYISELKSFGRDELDFWQVDCSDTIRSFLKEYEKEEISCPFTYKKYKDNKDIIDTIEAFGLDVEKFWYAVLFIYWLTQVKCVKIIERGDTVGEQRKQLIDFLKGIYSFTITAEGKKKLEISEPLVIKEIRGFLKTALNENEHGLNDSYSLKLNVPAHDFLHSSKQMFFSTNLYLKLFENLGLPTIRTKETQTENRTVSYNKMLLISRLMFFYGFTKNYNFLDSDESLKGIMKQYRDLEIKTISPKYMF